MKYGIIELFSKAHISNLKPEALSQVQEDALDFTDGLARIWWNSDVGALMYFDGTEVQQIAKGGSLNDYLKRDGTLAMTGELTLSSDDQSAAADTSAVSKKHVETRLATKEDNLTGAATSIAHADLGVNQALISDGAGKVAVSVATASELAQLTGMTENVNDKINTKQDIIPYTPVDAAGTIAMTANLMLGGNKVTGLANGTDTQDAVTFGQFENALAGLDFQKDIDDIQKDATLVPALEEGKRYIITDPAALAAEFGAIAGVEANDIVEYKDGAFVVAYDVSVEGEGVLAWNREGNYYFRFDGATWDSFGGLSGVNDGIGLKKDGDRIDVLFGAGITTANDADTLAIETYAAGSIELVSKADGSSATIDDGAAVLAVKLDGESMQSSAAGLRVKASGVTETELAASVAGFGLVGGAGAALGVAKLDDSIVIEEDGIKVNEAHTDTIYARQDGATFTGAVLVQDAAADAPSAAMPQSQVESRITEMAGAKIDEFAARFEASYHDTGLIADPTAALPVIHNIGTKSVQVVCYDEDDSMFIPNTVETTDENTVTVTVSESIRFRVVVQGMKPAA